MNNEVNFVPLKQLCIEVIDCPHSSPKWQKEGIPVIRNYNLKDGKIDLTNMSYVDEETYKKRIKRANPEYKDLVISREAPMGVAAIVPPDFKCCMGQRLVLLKVNKKICIPEYLLCAIQSQFVQTQIKRINQTGSIISNLNIPDLESLVIPMIGMNMQLKIANIYNCISNKIENNNAISSQLESLAKTIYDYWFLQFDFPDENGNPYRSSGGKMVWNDELKREIPEGWEVKNLQGLFNEKRGISYTSKNIKSNVGMPMINLACINTNREYRDGELKYYEGNLKNKTVLHGGELLVACTDLTRNADIIGCPIFVPEDEKEYLYTMDLVQILPSQKYFDELYFGKMLQTDYYHNYIKKWASGTNVLHLNLDGMRWYKTWIPPLPLQKRFSSIIKNIAKFMKNVATRSLNLA